MKKLIVLLQFLIILTVILGQGAFIYYEGYKRGVKDAYVGDLHVDLHYEIKPTNFSQSTGQIQMIFMTNISANTILKYNHAVPVVYPEPNK